MAKRIRSFAKAVSWRLLASVITLSVVWGATGDLKLSGIIGVLDFFIKIIVYYFHERYWAMVSWGRSFTHETPVRPNVKPSNNSRPH